ncbi:FecR domain-containing protein [Sphingobium sp. H39-3-25]|uniref:FecR family protein n=1 Tax=Sphingobium arseniciresistens TaxID=3030834 RepID=UPI0023B9D72A|nr:FecR domain-containing protein [Sphingobium arseniciresistens]
MMRLVYSANRAKAPTLDDEALDWVVKLTSGESSPEDHDAFRRWRDQSAEHLEALRRARAQWDQLGAALPSIQHDRDRRLRRQRRWKLGVPIAASLMLAISFGHGYWTSGRFDQVTAVGERRAFSLADGTRIMMSGDTALNVSFDKGVRRVELARGAIFVRVHHDAENPFVVYAGEARFRDVGTVFEVTRDGDGGRLVVEEGVVEASRGDRRKIVTANQAIAVTDNLGRLRWADAQAETAWVRGRLVLRNKTLPEILDILKPHYRGRIILLNSSFSTTRLNAEIDLHHIDSWLTALEGMKKIQATRLAGVTFLT